MEITILKERDTPLLSRKRITLEAAYGGATPSRIELKRAVADKIKSPESLVILKHIYTRFGKRKARIIAHVYSSEKELKALESEELIKKHSRNKEEKAEAAQ